ncbi:MAG TPA: L,D-transpeptidase family protein [Pyrinomonadaceae bacterium]|jgi:lipoprotein-anchoring transpeptidase ErfK/SrfK|nr:L,D-transpeptidase family protein [Pyrinomonadaceae bacterium]
MTIAQRLSAATAAALSFLLTLSFAGCQPAPSANAPASNANAPAANVNAASANAATPATNAGANAQPVTLAVLDAMLADDAFARDLKSRLQLTDDQIARLRKVAGEERAGLRESDEQSGTTTGATERASAKVREVVGADKADQLLALARERWAGEDAGAGRMSATGDKPNAVPADTRVVVNAPAFRMDVFEQGRLVKSYKVGIGYPEFPLPAGMRKADTIIFNPEWTPPDEPWVEAPGSKVKVGEKVAAGSKLNPLGPIKIPIGLPSLIHGGKQPARLGNFASHGCVGLTNELVQDFTRELARLGGTELNDEQIKTYAKNPTETKNVKLDHAVPVELRYETMVVTDDGKLHVYRDVYDRGTNTEETLRAVLQAHGVALDQLSEQERTQALDAVKQMARDATGNPADGGGTERPDTNANASGRNANAASKNANAAPGRNANAAAAEGAKVTRNVKGQREIVIEIAALKGKGYPVPVGGGFDTNEQGKQKADAPKKGKRR